MNAIVSLGVAGGFLFVARGGVSLGIVALVATRISHSLPLALLLISTQN
ncbi:hypothetical protein [Tabrizicola sp. BL-A-41-H6]